jgi:predicted MFS family arabinose efflux permease
MSAAGAALAGLALDPLGISGVLWTMAILLCVLAILWRYWVAGRAEAPTE